MSAGEGSCGALKRTVAGVPSTTVSPVKVAVGATLTTVTDAV